MLPKIIELVKQQVNTDGNSIDSFRVSKFNQVGLATYTCLFIVSIHFILIEKYETAVICGFIFLAMSFCFFWAKYKSFDRGVTLFLCMLTMACCYFMWRHEGLADEALLVFPGLLIFAAVIVNFKFAVVLLVVMIANVFAIGYVNETGIYINPPPKSNLNNAFLVSAILILLTFSVSFLAGELHQLLLKLNLENKRVKRSQKEIERLLNHDALTGLPNRVLAKEFCSQHIEQNTRAGHKTALLFIDMDDFKSVNDTLGHSIGDEYLVALSNKLKKELRGADTLCRVAGDEFIIIAEHKHETSSESILALRILSSLKEPITLQPVANDDNSLSNDIVLSASIGVSIYPDDGTDFETLCNNADLAMYKAKEGGRNNYCYFNPEMSKDNSRQLAVAQALRFAISNNELSLHYQTKQDLSTNKVVGAEALLRWESEKLGTVAPIEFIPIAEHSGSICDIGTWVLNNAVKTCKEWHEQGHSQLSISVNISSIQLKRGSFEDVVLGALDKYQLEGRFLVLELTESILFDMHEELSETMSSIKAAGVRLAIDDFGTGYSNLGYLKKIDISMLKIDRSFVSKINTSSHDLAIVRAIIEISNSLSIECVAEGIETQEVANTLQKLTCDLGQGYLWNKPMNAANFLAFLRSPK